MLARTVWQRKIANAWKHRPIIWLMGLRRAGKTVLARSLPDAEYFDCESPSVRARLADVEGFLTGMAGRTIVLDEVHRLDDPSEALKLAHDHFPTIRILATGSSSLAASRRFRDTLTGRKVEVWLTPMVQQDCRDFGNEDIEHRMLRGGLPSFFLSATLPEHDYEEWIDGYWARDIQELFRLERRQAFRRLLELLMIQSGGIFDASRFARDCGVSHTTIANYVAVLEETFAVHLVRPYAEARRAEIVSAPKAFAFDTGFVCHQRSWTTIRPGDRGTLWEHLVLNELHANIGRSPIRYWRNKRGNEIDFVVVNRGKPPIALDCKWSADEFEPAPLRAFRSLYPEGLNVAVTADTRAGGGYSKRFGRMVVLFTSIEDVAALIMNNAASSSSSDVIELEQGNSSRTRTN